jgi:RecA-family ATPase
LALRGRIAGLKVSEIIERIIGLARELQAGLVVIDPIYKLNQRDENSSRDQTALCNEIDRLTTEGDPD